MFVLIYGFLEKSLKSPPKIAFHMGATTECRATFKHSPNEPARLARQWMKERGIIVCALSVGFIYLVARLARLARQWKTFSGVKCWVHIFSGSFGSFGSAVDERTRNDCMHVNCWVHIFSGSFGSFGSAVDRTRNNWYACKSKRAKRAGSFGAWLKVALYSVV